MKNLRRLDAQHVGKTIGRHIGHGRALGLARVPDHGVGPLRALGDFYPVRAIRKQQGRGGSGVDTVKLAFKTQGRVAYIYNAADRTSVDKTKY